MTQAMTIDELIAYITTHFEGVDVVTYPPGQEPTAWFLSLDPDKHWPNFATIVTTDEHDTEPSSNLTARGAYRLNLSLSRQQFDALIDRDRDYDYTATDVVIPHPTYAKQHWIGIVNPSRASFDAQLDTLIHEAYERLATPRKK